ncbi:MAG TPA: thioredoxin family protein [Polyangia bacterium]|nr:thioredoxin family protein [Polyangia bacterium]
MLTSLDAARLDEFVRQAGVTIVEWRHPKSIASLLFDQILERVARAQRDVRFATIDLSKEAALAQDWEVAEAPTVMGFRDGTLVFSRSGPLPEAAVDRLIDAIWSLDMAEVRKAIDGHGGRAVISFRADREPAFEVAAGAAPGGRGGSSPGADR